ncbi:NTPase KAP family P-loop domain-containing protein 1 [Nerophis ophidion]|uniref:NTPase KAP family P-loop domain-containing protein 1 n=1 Tax=Nerophis ophidion TaxID=159077 RepID=UPI002ADF9B14|nr:NTPase KAP family P-loop domain-containing protein 1 [Nerophis ophidion]XP_061743327.1 NTPase KAP family P-loop domain-containing protein 1 [Nerophis ophidion]
MSPPSKDDIFAYALSKTLTQVSSPATVGLYSSCQSRIRRVLRKMEVFMTRETARLEEHTWKPRPRTVKLSLCGMLALLGRLLFYKPIWTRENQDHYNVRFIYVNFSAWHFAGSDLLWAGLAIRLLQAVEIHFGKLLLALYRVAQHDEEEEIKKKIMVDGPNHWRSKRICCCPLWCFILLSLLVPIILLIFLHLSFDLSKIAGKRGQNVNSSASQAGGLQGLLMTLFGIPATTVLVFLFKMGKSLVFSQERNIQRGMDNDQVSAKLGFMNKVRKEMWLISRYVEFMEVFERRRIRVVLRITNLDRCSPRKIVAVLDAINILLSDEDSPFISVLAVDPEMIVQKVNFAEGCFCREDRGYALLNRIVTLAFTVPPLCDDSKLCLFQNLASGSRTPEDLDEDQTEKVEVRSETEEDYPLIDRDLGLCVTEADIEHCVERSIGSIERKLKEYFFDDAMSMRRVVNTIRVTVIITKALKIKLPQPDLIAAWVVLANQWPCRLSWIIQCVEDTLQRAKIDHDEAVAGGSKTLWNVFSESRAELYVMRGQIEDLLDQDGDPEMFERFLKRDFQLTVEDLKAFSAVTVNLNHSLKKELAQIRGTTRLNDSGWMRAFAPLPIPSIIKMDSEDICKELEKMKYPIKYADIVKDNGISGSALVFGDQDDIKKLLDMTFGEWTTFRLHFLGSPLRKQLPRPSSSQQDTHHHPHLDSS